MRIYLVEDDPDEAAYAMTVLRQGGYEVVHFADPNGLFRFMPNLTPGLIILDWMLPGMNGFQTLRRAREVFGQKLPIMMLTHVDDQDRIVEALEGGADDYLIKPFVEAIFIARVNALLRRVGSGRKQNDRVIEMGPYRLDYATQEATIEGKPVAMTPKEFDVVWVLLSHTNRFVSKAELMVSVWGKGSDIGSHTMAQHIHAVRKKMAFVKHRFRLTAVYGAGYRFETPEVSQVVDRLLLAPADPGADASLSSLTMPLQ